MPMSLDAAAEVFREAMRDTVKRYSLWYLIQGVLLIAAGVLAIIYPVISSAAVIVLLGWLLIISGVVQGLSLIGARHVPHFWLQLISVILAVLIGFLFLRDPAQGLVTIALLLIVFFMIEGISKVVFALTIRPFPNWGWVLASGLVGILLSLILWANLPVTALWLVGVLLGINLISVGAAIAYLAWQVRRADASRDASVGVASARRSQAHDVCQEFFRAFLPSAAKSEVAAGRAGNAERTECRRAQVRVENADRLLADDVQGPRHRKACHRKAARKRLEEHDPVGIGPAREHEDVSRRIDAGEAFAGPRTKEDGLAVARREVRAMRAIADDDFRPGQIEVKEGFDVLLHRKAADIEKDRSRQVERLPRARPKQVGVDAPRPEGEVLEPTLRQFLPQ